MPGGVANKSFVAEWDCFCRAMDSNDFMKLPSHSALALSLLSKCGPWHSSAGRASASSVPKMSAYKALCAAGAFGGCSHAHSTMCRLLRLHAKVHDMLHEREEGFLTL